MICTGNICRSPMAEALLRRRLASLDEGRGAGVKVRSAGLVFDGAPASEHGVGVLADQGIDLAGHRSRLMTHDLVERADLVLGMAREHVRAAVTACPAVWPRAFTLRELVRRGEDAGPRAAGQDLDEWLEKVAAGRTTAGLLGESPLDDVADPIGQPRSAYERTAAELDGLVRRLIELVWGRGGRHE